MAEGTKAARAGVKEVVLTIDVGGSHVKVQTSTGSEIRRTDSGPGLTPAQTVDKVRHGLSIPMLIARPVEDRG